MHLVLCLEEKHEILHLSLELRHLPLAQPLRLQGLLQQAADGLLSSALLGHQGAVLGSDTTSRFLGNQTEKIKKIKTKSDVIRLHQKVRSVFFQLFFRTQASASPGEATTGQQSIGGFTTTTTGKYSSEDAELERWKTVRLCHTPLRIYTIVSDV